MISNGASYPGLQAKREILLQYEQTLLKLQIQFEDAFRGLAAAQNQPAIIVCDRGALDIAAYLPEDLWNETMHMSGSTPESLNQRYDSVIHLVTAACGAEQFYTRSNNAARTETAEEARVLDSKVRRAWIGHPSLHIIPNDSEGFEGKMAESIAIIENRIYEIIGK